MGEVLLQYCLCSIPEQFMSMSGSDFSQFWSRVSAYPSDTMITLLRPHVTVGQIFLCACVVARRNNWLIICHICKPAGPSGTFKFI